MMFDDEKKPYVLVSAFKEDAKQEDVEQSTPALALILDEWQLSGKMIWSGSFDDNKSAMSVIEASKNEADDFLSKYKNATDSFLSTYMYQWDAMPLLSLLGNKQTQATLTPSDEIQDNDKISHSKNMY